MFLPLMLFLLAMLILGFIFSLVVQLLRVEKTLKDLYIHTETEVKIFFESGNN